MGIDLDQRLRSQIARQNQLLYRTPDLGLRTHDDDGQPIMDPGLAARALDKLGVPRQYVTGTFNGCTRSDRDNVRDWWRAARDGLQREPLGLHGRGADKLAAACARSAIVRGIPFGWMNWGAYTAELLDKIDHSKADTEEYAEVVSDRIAERQRRQDTYELLVVSDFSLRDVKDFMVDDVMRLFDSRERNELITLITTSDGNYHMIERIDEAITVRAPLVRWLQEEVTWSGDGGE